MRAINGSSKYKKILLFHGGEDKLIAFEQPIDIFLWYRVFIKPSGRFIALKDMNDAKENWQFLCSINLAKMYPGGSF